MTTPMRAYREPAAVPRKAVRRLLFALAAAASAAAHAGLLLLILTTPREPDTRWQLDYVPVDVELVSGEYFDRYTQLIEMAGALPPDPLAGVERPPAESAVAQHQEVRPARATPPVQPSQGSPPVQPSQSAPPVQPSQSAPQPLAPMPEQDPVQASPPAQTAESAVAAVASAEAPTPVTEGAAADPIADISMLAPAQDAAAVAPASPPLRLSAIAPAEVTQVEAGRPPIARAVNAAPAAAAVDAPAAVLALRLVPDTAPASHVPTRLAAVAPEEGARVPGADPILDLLEAESVTDRMQPEGPVPVAPEPAVRQGAEPLAAVAAAAPTVPRETISPPIAAVSADAADPVPPRATSIISLVPPSVGSLAAQRPQPVSRVAAAVDDPAAAVAQVAPPRPELPVTDPEEAIRDAIASISCSRISASLSLEDEAVELFGHVPSTGAVRELVQSISSVPGIAHVSADGLQIIEGPFCDVLAFLRLSHAFPSNEQVPHIEDAIARAADAPVQHFAEGAQVAPYLLSPGFPSFLYVDYFSADGSVHHMFPAGGEANHMPPETELRVGAGRGRAAVAHGGQPFGLSLVLALASSEPLLTLRRPPQEDAQAYLRDLDAALRQLADEGIWPRLEYAYYLVQTRAD